MPGSQPPFSLIPEADTNKGDTSFISVVVYGVYILLSRPIQFCPLPNQNFEKNAKDTGDPAEPWIQDPSGFLQIFMGFKSFNQKNLQSYKTLLHGQSNGLLRSTVDHCVLPELTFKDKTPQGMEHVWSEPQYINPRPDGPLDFPRPDGGGC